MKRPKFRARGYGVVAAIIAVCAAWSASAAPLSFKLDPTRSVFAIVTHKAGLAAAFAHSHLVSATRYEASLSADPVDLTLSRFEFQTRVQDLDIDDPNIVARVRPALIAMAIKDDYPKLSMSNRDTTRKNMWSPQQLDAEQFPLISANVIKIEAVQTRIGEVVFDYILDMQITLHGRSVTRRIPAHISINEHQLAAEALGALRFSDFNIEPFRSVGGLIRVEDRFHLYVKLAAQRQ